MSAADGALRFLERVEQDRSEDALDRIVATAEGGASVAELVTGQLASVQRLVGERWHEGAYTVADEHRTSAVVEDALGLLRRRVPRDADAPRVALVCAVDEWHVTPARMAALALGEAGWHVDLLGASTPPDHLQQALTHTRPQVLAISATLPLSLRGVPPLVDVARSLKIPVLGGGAAFGATAHRARMLGLDGHAPDAASAARLMTGWLDQPPVGASPAVGADVLAEQEWLQLHRSDLVTRAVGRLRSRLPAMAGYDQRQLDHTRRDLDYTLQFLETSLLVDDPSLFGDYVAWLRLLLARRGLPPQVLSTSLTALARVIDGEHPRSREILSAARFDIDGAPS